MNPTTIFYELLLRGDLAGNLAGMHFQRRTLYRDESGAVLTERILDPEPVEAGSACLAEILPALNTSALAQVATLSAQLATAQDAVAAGEATIAGLQAQIDTLSAPPAEPDLLANLNAVFAAAVPEQARGAFAQPYALVRILIQAGQIAMARSVIENTPVPAELAGAKAQILAALASPASA